MNVLDLFSGIGGFSLGLERAGMKTIAFCEIEEFPRKVLRKHWPNVPIFEDVRKLHATDIQEPIDLICGGYPCQPFSVAGKRQGQADDRHLWPEMFRLIREIRPNWVIAENVAGHVNMGLDEVLFDLEGEGYETTAFIIPACAVNAPHRRDRLWIVANNESQFNRGYHGEQKERQGTQLGKSNGNRIASDTERIDGNATGYGASKISQLEATKIQRLCSDSNASSTGREKFDTPAIAAIAGYSAGGINQEWDRNWIDVATATCIRRVAHGLPRKLYRNQRLKALGNSVVPQIPELIGRTIMEIEEINDDNRN